MIKKSQYVTVSDIVGGIPDIIQEIVKMDRISAHYTVKLAEKLRGQTREETYRNIWAWVRSHIVYIEDAEPQIVKSPGATWKDRIADCKSMAILVGSILQNMRIPYKLRFAFYDPENPDQGHVYVVAPNDSGNWVAIDPVNPVFLDEPQAWKKRDKKGNKIKSKWKSKYA